MIIFSEGFLPNGPFNLWSEKQEVLERTYCSSAGSVEVAGKITPVPGGVLWQLASSLLGSQRFVSVEWWRDWTPCVTTAYTAESD